MEVPSSWWTAAERKLYSPRETKKHFEKLLSLHPNPGSLIEYLNERRFTLLLEILEQSECLRSFLFRHPEDFQNTIPELWYLTKDKERYLEELSHLLHDTMGEEELSEKLAYYRHRELLRIFAKVLLGTAKMEDILREYSYLPDAMLEVSYRRAFEEAVEKYGEPLSEDGNRVTGVVIGLGKLGSEELNFYSDIDLIFLHSEDRGSAGKLSLNEFFAQVFKKVLKLMTTQTQEGKPYEVDLDLRPFGKTGPITMSLRSAELYYESYGRVWERFALLRARPVAGDMELGERFMREVVNPFVYSSADYKLVEEIKRMKQRIEAEAKKKFLKGYNVKTGEGGIREIEFTVQSLLILLGNKNRFVRERNTFKGIWKLNQKGVFSDEEALFLERAYSFLRDLEHRIQLKRCLQTQTLNEQDIPFIARALGFEKESFTEELHRIKAGVREIFAGLIPERREEELQPVQIALITEDVEYGVFLLKEAGFRNPRQSFSLLLSYLYGKEGLKLSDKEKEKFLRMVPRIVDLSAVSSDPDETLKNFDKFLSNPTGKRVILSDPKEDFLEGLFNVFSLSSTLSSLISKNPDLVEDVLTLYREYPTWDKLEEEFRKYEETLNLTEENLFRRFKKVWEVRIGLVYLMGKRNYDNLTGLFRSMSMLADFLLIKLWEKITLEGNKAVLYSLGKLGSRELNFGSDLDLVFCVESNDEKEEVTKKTQRLVRFLTVHTSEGYLYDVDFRLRPMGSKGELVPTLDFYTRYFKKEARTWERLAWTRARFITGEEALKERFEGEIENLLFEKPWGEEERKEVYQMRMKLQEQAKKGKGVLDLKFGVGGIVDGEFLVQYLLIKERIRETSMIEGFKRLSDIHPALKEAFEPFMFLRLVETHLRLVKERGSSVLSREDIPKIARSLNMKEGDFEEELSKSMKILREVFLEYLG
ncbi:glutamate-ammonia-ligase adenylyltransferase [Hydrogenivirga caldilitoris]|uniref:Glutamate-ammonia-ligase adenylyltransferase n=1 Tax=Hydrogenivirga caldilitoris TaxID=246264 RepID=A0A497XNB3_9AQUI|nr:glutamine-synthetase adenylyltransferase [Hydrogenivirga caldilitoris]RLJ70446.1 glutamate-ammonia-ligase adenylyltransferase [Hydrogenivirga caldilitoris]